MIRIASFNVENLTDAPSAEVPLAARLEVLRPQLERAAADVLCLQEVDAGKPAGGKGRALSALTDLLKGTDYAGFDLAATTHPQTGRPRDKHNLVVLSRWPIRALAQYANDLVDAPRYRCATAAPAQTEAAAVAWDRPLLHVEIELAGARVLHLLNLHLRAPLASAIPGQKLAPFVWKTVPGWAEGYFLAAMKRTGQALEARLVVDRIFDRDPAALVVVAGDFNAEEREVPLRLLLGDPEDTGNGRLAPRSLVLPEHSLSESRRFTVIHRGSRRMLDHLLVSRPLMAHFRGIEVHNEMLGDELVAYTLIEAAPDSYHAPVVAEFDLDGPADADPGGQA